MRGMCSLIVVLLFAPAILHASSLPDGFTESQIVNGLKSPITMDFAPDGRVFICEQAGTLRVVKNGVLLPTPFLSVTTQAITDRGLVAVAVDPNFNSNQYIYVVYTVPATSTAAAYNTLSRFTANGDVAAAGSETFIFRMSDL